MAANPETLQVPLTLYHIVKGKGRNSHWRKFGVGFKNRDGSINVLVDLFPGQHFQLRVADPEEIRNVVAEEAKNSARKPKK